MAKNRQQQTNAPAPAQSEWDRQEEVEQLAREIFVARGCAAHGFDINKSVCDAFDQAEQFVAERDRRNAS